MVIDADGLVTLPELAKEAGLDTQVLWRATNEGLINRATVRRRHGTTTFTREDAMLVLMVAGWAIVAGVAFMTVLRIIRSTGATIADGTLTIPIPAPAISINT